MGRRWGPRVFGAVMAIGAPDDNGHDVLIRPCETPPAEKQLRELLTASPDGTTYPSLCPRKIRLARLRVELWILICQLWGLRFVRSIGSGCLESTGREDPSSGERRRQY